MFMGGSRATAQHTVGLPYVLMNEGREESKKSQVLKGLGYVQPKVSENTF